jgi:hypothetical protein
VGAEAVDGVNWPYVLLCVFGSVAEHICCVLGCIGPMSTHNVRLKRGSPIRYR